MVRIDVCRVNTNSSSTFASSIVLVNSGGAVVLSQAVLIGTTGYHEHCLNIPSVSACMFQTLDGVLQRPRKGRRCARGAPARVLGRNINSAAGTLSGDASAP